MQTDINVDLSVSSVFIGVVVVAMIYISICIWYDEWELRCDRPFANLFVLLLLFWWFFINFQINFPLMAISDLMAISVWLLHSAHVVCSLWHYQNDNS